MSIQTRTWLASYFQTTTKFVDEMLKDEKATTYLLVWPIFEQKLFNGFMKQVDIQSAASKYAVYYGELNADVAVQHFHDRYQDSRRYKNLRHNDSATYITKILSQKIADLSNEDKLVLLIYVVYRYRNNIFHGNKGIASWSNYTTQINLCLDFMMAMLDCAEKHKGDIA